MNYNKNIAVLLTCFNRRESSLKCIKQLLHFNQDVDIFLVDDNSSDGTSKAISDQYPQVNLIKGTGNLFWTRGMYLAWENATKDYNYYLWLNDDVVLYENCFKELFECVKLTNDMALISGVIETAEKNRILYGGTDENKKLITPNGKLNPITNMNGNVVLIPKYVYNKLGKLDPKLHHDLGDVDYGLRAKANGIGVFTTRIAIASGEKNDFCRVRLNNSSLFQRFKKLYSPLGSNPLIDFYFRKKHFGFSNAALNFLFLHFINIVPDKIMLKLFGEKYT
ncbi:glycosyltransferase family 2 protein [Flavihumibacter sp. R14]|nr:glycosyltransferase family 2 protein [Flavihumibacter soli]